MIKEIKLALKILHIVGVVIIILSPPLFVGLPSGFPWVAGGLFFFSVGSLGVLIND